MILVVVQQCGHANLAGNSLFGLTGPLAWPGPTWPEGALARPGPAREHTNWPMAQGGPARKPSGLARLQPYCPSHSNY